MEDKINYWESDGSVSDDEPTQPVVPNRNPQLELYEESLNKYVTYLKEFSSKAECIEADLFGDGIWYVNHPLIEITQINYEKNIGIFDTIDLEKESSAQPSTISYKKLIVVFTFVENEIAKVLQTLENDLYDKLLMYGEQPQKSTELLELMTARGLAVYKKIYDLVKKLMAYIEHLIIQLHCIINKKNPNYKANFRGANFYAVFDLLGTALRAIYVVDCIVQNNASIIAHLEMYKKMLKLAKNQPEKFNVTPQKVKRIEKSIVKYQNTILSGKCMQTITEITYDELLEKTNNPLGKINKNKELKEALQAYFIYKVQEINEFLGSRYEHDEEKKMLDLLCLYSFFRKLYPDEELKDVWRELWTFQKTVPIIEAHSFVCVYIFAFLLKVCPLSKRPKTDPKDEQQFMLQYMNAMEETVGHSVMSYYNVFCVWLSRMESTATENSFLKQKSMKDRISNRIFMLCEGFNIVLKFRKVLYGTFILHANEQKTISKPLLDKLILGIETLKATVFVLRKKAAAFDTAVLVKYITHDMLELLNPYMERIKTEEGKKMKEQIHKAKIFLFLVGLLGSPISQLKLTFIRYSLGLLTDWAISETDLKRLKMLLKKLDLVAYSRVLMQQYQNCGFLFFSKAILPEFFTCKRDNPNTIKRLQFLFQGLEDVAILTKQCFHLADPNQIFQQFKLFLEGAFEMNYMIPLRKKLQDFLRITVSSMRIEKLEGMRPWSGQIVDLVKMIQLQKIRIFDTVIDIRFELARAFNHSFYNLNVLNLHDMESYECMRVLAEHLFEVKLHDVYMPSHTLEQSKFDILQIVRNIPAFIEKYKYNLLSQRFLELTGENKIITCVSIQQLADAIRTHGLGILATTVNAFYQYLVPKIKAFNEFLFDDQIQIPLTKERKWFKEYTERKDYPGYYPFNRVENLYKQIKKIGKFEDDCNYLDKFREIVTAVGNSLGFIRLLRSASLNTESKTLEHLPKKIDIHQNLEEVAGKSTLKDSAKAACKELDDLLKACEDKFSDKIDYLSVIMKAFSKIVTKQNKHLKLFYLLVPVLSLNYVEHVAKGKEQIQKRITFKAFLYDDGFMLGLAYFLTLIKQHQHYRTMHWDISLSKYFVQAKAASKDKQLPDSSVHSAKYIEELNTKKQMLTKKVEMMEDEFAFFNYNLISANVLFKTSLQSKEVPKSPPSG